MFKNLQLEDFKCVKLRTKVAINAHLHSVLTPSFACIYPSRNKIICARVNYMLDLN